MNPWGQRFADRSEAGRELAELLATRSDLPRDQTIVLALPRGGVVVGFEVARRLGVPLDVIVARKLGAPMQPELALGAVTAQGHLVLDRELVRSLHVSDTYLQQEQQAQIEEAQRREVLYRKGRPPLDLAGRTVILVDDGVATGATLRAALRAVRMASPARVIVALPVGPPDTIEHLRREADDVICLRTPEPFFAVGAWYRDFRQVSDEEVQDLLDRSHVRSSEQASSADAHEG